MSIKSFKKCSLTALFFLLAFTVIAQDSANKVKPFTGTKGFRKWSIGVNVGATSPMVATGGTNDFLQWKVGLGYGVNVKYQATHWLGFQADGFRANVKGDQTEPWGNGQMSNRPVDEFETQVNWGWDIITVFSPGNINWLSRKTKIVPYVSFGAGIINYKPEIRLLGTTTKRLYNPTDNISEFIVPVSAGLRMNVSKAMNIDLGYRMFYTDGDNFDGFYYTRNSKDKWGYGFLGVEFALGNKSKPQLMFNNPAAAMDASLRNEATELRLMIDMADTDGDGVPDKFDKEPNTPINCPVDTKGISRDTDGDGIPDCRDKQLITPTECQPVDAEGVGKCPPPSCCATHEHPGGTGTGVTGTGETTSSCTIGDLPSISFKGNTAGLSSDAQSMLASIAAKLKAQPTCNINVQGFAGTSKAAASLCNKRINAIRLYLIEKQGIAGQRISANCMTGGDVNTVDISGQ